MKKLMLPILAAIATVAQAMESGTVGVYCLDKDGSPHIVRFEPSESTLFTIFSQPGFVLAETLGLENLPGEDLKLRVWSLIPAPTDEKMLTHTQVVARQYEQINLACNFAFFYNFSAKECPLNSWPLEASERTLLHITLELLGANPELMRRLEKDETA